MATTTTATLELSSMITPIPSIQSLKRGNDPKRFTYTGGSRVHRGAVAGIDAGFYTPGNKPRAVLGVDANDIRRTVIITAELATISVAMESELPGHIL